MVFQKVSKFNDVDIKMPERATTGSAGYDFFAAEDVVIPPFDSQYMKLLKETNEYEPLTLEAIAEATKKSNTRFTLVSTGVKCQMPKDVYLELTSRSSVPLKNWLVLANGVGVIDADYYNNEDNEGEIFLQFINLSPCSILIKEGDKIGQGIFHKYLVTANEEETKAKRTGGFGSTT
jgi:dUTP pyrophosphatase